MTQENNIENTFIKKLQALKYSYRPDIRTLVDKNFIVYFLRLERTQIVILTRAGASTIPDLNHKDFYSIEAKFSDKKEQQKIADCLSSLDTLITAQAEKIEQLKHHKKGLMQQLFPTLDGVGA